MLIQNHTLLSIGYTKPFGESWIDQRVTSWNAPYTFSEKEKGEETGYGYFKSAQNGINVKVYLQETGNYATYNSFREGLYNRESSKTASDMVKQIFKPR